jgi:uncharacterized protein YjbI with pentapeptide repeats
VFAEFQEKDVSEKPANYWQIPENNLPKYVKGATLKNRNLENADMSEAFLVKADLRKGNLQNVHLKDANLQNANLEGANLQNAYLGSADLTGAKNLSIEQLSEVKTLHKAKSATTSRAGCMWKAPGRGHTLLVVADLYKEFWLRDTFIRIELTRINCRNIF